MTLRRATWIVLAGLALWACGGGDGGDSTNDTTGPDTAYEVGPDVVDGDTAVETVPDTAYETSPDAVEETTPDTVEETTPDTVEEATEVEETEVVDPESEFSKLIAHVEVADYVNTKLPNVVAAADVMAAGLETYVIIDVRMKDRYGPGTDGVWQKVANGTPDFDDGHIEGAINMAWNQVVDYAEANLTPDDKILVVCYTGQDAGHSVLALNLLGYDAYSLKWGMSAWNAVFDLWSGATADTWADQFTTDPDTGKNAAGDYPELSTGKETAEEILRARIDVLQATGTTRLIDATTVLAAPEDFYVVNYWPEADYLNPGHLVGAHQYTPKASLKSTADLATLPTDQKIAVYCYSGQQSSQLAAFLTVLGYDAYSVKFGTNAMIYSQMTKQQWTGPGDYTFIGAPVVQQSEFSKLVGHLEGAGGNYLNTAAPKVIAAADVLAAGLDSWVILDLRNKDFGTPSADGFVKTPNGNIDYDDGHIEGAVNVGWADLVQYVKDNLTVDDKILLVCWTGQSASQASLMLNLAGYDSSSLKWGMSGWNKSFDMVSGSISSDWIGQFTTDADTGKNDPGDYPTLSTGETDAMAILNSRVATYSAGSAKSIKAADLFAALDDYYVINYWPEAEYLAPGHIVGSHQYTPKASLLTAADLATLPTDQKIVVYCYTGQTSSQVAAFLNILGYDAYSLQFGTNGMIFDQMIKGQWAGSGDYAYISNVVVNEFDTLITYLEGEGGDFLNTASPKIVGAADVMAAGLENWVIIDLRNKDLGTPTADGFDGVNKNGIIDFEDGHIDGAINVGWADVVQYAKDNLTKDDKILIVCWTGQSAAQVSMLLNLEGFDSTSLNWGMSGWNKQFDMWSSRTSSDWAGQFTTDADTGKDEPGDYPTLDTGELDGAAILDARVMAFQASGAKQIKAADLFAAIDDYYVINYWPGAEYLDPGHIIGSHQYTPKASLLTSADLATLPADGKIVVYCYTGQNSGHVAAWLNLLGYDAYSLANGTNGMIYDQMTKSQWTAAGDYAFVQ